jgi:hypothetical protein
MHSASIQNDCRAGPRSQLQRLKSRSCGCSAVPLRTIARLLGTEFLEAETGRQKSSRKSVNACRDQSPGSKWPEIPAEAPNLASTREGVACGDWMVEAVGHKLATHHPVIEPVSAAEPGTEICDAETGTQKPTYHLAETNPETRRSAKSPHSGAINAKRLAKV